MALVVNRKKCDGCGECVRLCPFDAITLESILTGAEAGVNRAGSEAETEAKYIRAEGEAETEAKYIRAGSEAEAEAVDKVVGGFPVINAACRMCGICVRECVPGALVIIDDERREVDKSAWSGVLVFAEASGGRLHPVVRELAGKAHELADKVGYDISAVLMTEGAGEMVEGAGDMTEDAGEMAGKARELADKVGYDISAVLMAEDAGDMAEGAGDMAAELLTYGFDKVYTYEHEAFRYFRADAYADAFADVIEKVRPSIVLTGATSVGRSLAPRVSTRLRTGLTADCTGLDVTEDTDLVQIRPAFGGNIMAEIITPRSRPQFATVRYKVMDAAPLTEPHGEIIKMPVPSTMTKSGIEMVSVAEKPPSDNISEAEILVVGGKGLKSPEDLEMVKALAKKLNGQYAVTRPLVEAGWAPQIRQIGLSGRTVKPKLLMTFGVSGAVQFTAAMRDSECIFAVNKDADAPIMDIAHYCVVGDLYEILPGLLGS